MVPPQDSPIFSKFSSSLIPNSSICGSPVSITSIAECTTAGSTHPPLTEPDNSPLSLTASFAPGLRGAEPYIVTTVATATRSPRSRHRSTSGKMSRIEFLPSFDIQFFPKAQALILKHLHKGYTVPNHYTPCDYISAARSPPWVLPTIRC